MLLRDHPLMQYHGVRNWPPAWTWTGGPEKRHPEPRGEIGIVRQVEPSKISPPKGCFVYIELKDQNTSAACCLMTGRSVIK